MPYINRISTANPQYCIEQNNIASFMSTAMKLKEDEERKLKAIFRISGIKTRYSVLSDYQHGDPTKWEFYPSMIDEKPTTAQRMQKYEQEALSLALDSCEPILAENKVEGFTHLITVSCTGMFAPGLDIQLIKSLGLNSNVERTSIQFMGCFAAFNALKNAYHICKSRADAKVLVVCLELCTLHFQANFNEDNLLANTLFADGAASVVVSNENKEGSLSIDQFESVLHEDSENEMAWHIGNSGFEMKLSSYVPKLLSDSIETLADKLIEASNLDISRINYYAVHPGGKRILSAVEDALNLPRYKIDSSYSILENYGNMSSPTVLFVLKDLIEKASKDESIMAFAFGPGLTMESMLLSKK